jgi:glutaredoxin/glutathione-dependent peroxiredoxin
MANTKREKRRTLSVTKTAHGSPVVACSALLTPHRSFLQQGTIMTIKIGDTLPAGTLFESVGQDDAKNCPMPPTPVDMKAFTAGKKVVIFGLPGAFTPTCSSQHVPGYLKNYDALKAKGVDAIACMSVNDGFVMGAWGQTQNVGDKIRMLGDGSAAFTKAMGLELDLTAKGMGVRCQRFSLLVDNGVVKQVNIEGVGAPNCSFAENMLAQLG